MWYAKVNKNQANDGKSKGTNKSVHNKGSTAARLPTGSLHPKHLYPKRRRRYTKEKKKESESKCVVGERKKAGLSH